MGKSDCTIPLPASVLPAPIIICHTLFRQYEVTGCWWLIQQAERLEKQVRRRFKE